MNTQEMQATSFSCNLHHFRELYIILLKNGKPSAKEGQRGQQVDYQRVHPDSQTRCRLQYANGNLVATNGYRGAPVKRREVEHRGNVSYVTNLKLDTVKLHSLPADPASARS